MKLGALLLGMLAPAVFGFMMPEWEATDEAPSRRDEQSRSIRQKLERLMKTRKRTTGDVRERTLRNIKRDMNTRLSFKECSLDPGMRENCGYFGIEEVECYRRGCCWSQISTKGVPWCYHSKPTLIPQCAVANHERNECGSYGINKEECEASKCCWKPSNEAGVPWCYYYRRQPVYEGECGVPPIPPIVSLDENRIVNGIEAKEHSWPWMISMQTSRGHFCGGSLINDQWILTAAHCSQSFAEGEAFLVVGMHSKTSEAQFQRTVTVDQVIPHSEYHRGTIDKDVMLLKLSEKIEFGETIQPVCLPEQGQTVAPGTRCYTTGWGTLEFLGETPDKLQQVMTPLIADETCNEGGWYDGQITENMVCAGYQQGGRAACHGDSGGPLVCYVDDHWLLYGVASWSYVCAEEEHPTVFARVSRFTAWIEQTIANDV